MHIAVENTSGSSDLYSLVTNLAQCIYNLREKYSLTAPLPLLAVAGTFNAGKSTLINGLLNSKVSPVDVLPSTPCPVLFQYGDRFHAYALEGIRRREFFSQRELSVYLTRPQRRATPHQAAISLPCAWLKLCRMLDTPGIDTAQEIDLSPAGSDLLVYIFHQRGMEENDRRFLQQLKARRGRRRNISFWINCNHGRPDGTALVTTRNTLTEIFGREVPLYYLNTKDPWSMKHLKYFLTVELSSLALEELQNTLKKVDQSIPGRLKKISGLPSNVEFLLKFWILQEETRNILDANRLREMLPAARRQVRLALTVPPPANPVQPDHRLTPKLKTIDLTQIKEKLKELIQRLQAEVTGRETTRELAGLFDAVSRDTFFVTAWGSFSSGKSTFFNALMGEALLPAQDKPTTGCVTRLQYGREKKAVLNYARQITLPVCIPAGGGGQFQLHRQALLLLQKWLADHEFTAGIAGVEILLKDKFIPCELSRLSLLLAETSRIFASPYLLPSRDNPVPALARLLNRKRAADAVKTVRLSFRQPGRRIYRLNEPAERQHLGQLIASDEALRLESVDIFFPAELFKLATFIDTPGLDPTPGLNGDAAGWLQNSDLGLFFLHGRHILAEKTHQDMLQILAGRLEQLTGEVARDEAERFFFLVNFADTLNRVEKERVVNHVRRRLAADKRLGTAMPWAQVYLISSLAALEGKDDGSFQRFLRQLERAILNRRGKGILAVRAAMLGRLLEQCCPGDSSDEHRWQQYRSELKEIQQMLKSSGGYRRWKTPAL